MKPQPVAEIDISKIDSGGIRDVKKRILGQITQWLFGLDDPAEFLTECLFMLVPYTDKILHQKLAGQPHIMFRGGTGIGKTDLCQSLAMSVRAEFKRLSGTPDMFPYDILGGQILVENTKGERRVQFKPGPIFTHMLLVDEANRINPKTKSAVLEAMEERSVTPKCEYIDDSESVVGTLPLFPLSGDYLDMLSPRFFLAMLTENIFGEEDGAYPSPMAELDRITLTIPIERPSFENEEKIRSVNVKGKLIKPVTDLQEILACAYWIDQNVVTSPMANNYLTQLIRNTDPDPKITDLNSKLGKFLEEYVRVGASPRVNFHLEAVARVHAFFDGSMVVRPEHAKAVAKNVIVHRLVLKPSKVFNSSKEEVFNEILELTGMPKWKK